MISVYSMGDTCMGLCDSPERGWFPNDHPRHRTSSWRIAASAPNGGFDPEIQAILQDPVTQQVLRDFQENPAAAQQAMNDPSIQAKIQKLIASGIVETR